MMMTNWLRISSGLLFLLALSLAVEPVYAQRDHSRVRPSPNAKISQTIGMTEIDMHYGRPGVRGRAIYGELVPWDAPWRAGADEPTTIELGGDVLVEGQSLEAGTYNIFIRPAQNGPWNVIFTTPVRWGTMFGDATPVLEVSVTPNDGPHQEWLQYRFEDLSDTSATLVMHWERMMLPVRLSLPQ
jgi:hypothetical protein